MGKYDRFQPANEHHFKVVFSKLCFEFIHTPFGYHRPGGIMTVQGWLSNGKPASRQRQPIEWVPPRDSSSLAIRRFTIRPHDSQHTNPAFRKLPLQRPARGRCLTISSSFNGKIYLADRSSSRFLKRPWHGLSISVVIDRPTTKRVGPHLTSGQQRCPMSLGQT